MKMTNARIYEDKKSELSIKSSVNMYSYIENIEK